MRSICTFMTCGMKAGHGCSKADGRSTMCSTCSGHASLQQTSTYLNATLRGLHESMQHLDQSRPACKRLAKKPARGFRPIHKQTPARSEKSFLH